MGSEKMLILAVVAVATSIVSVEGSMFRIISGFRTSAIDFPYQAEIEYKGKHWCGGSIIQEYYILSAAHCVKDARFLRPVPMDLMLVRVGNDIATVGGEIYQIDKVMPHQSYDDNTLIDKFDISLIKLVVPLKFGPKVQPVSLALENPRVGDLGWVTGFGKIMMERSTTSNPRPLRAVLIPVVTAERCKKYLGEITNDVFCAGFEKGHRDACTGDSGGPFVINSIQAGVVSWGIGCGQEGVPGVYTNVAIYKDWIIETVSKENTSSPVYIKEHI